LSELGEVSTVGWGLIMVLAVVNYFKIKVIDPNIG
jgi:hypothetical protein